MDGQESNPIAGSIETTPSSAPVIDYEAITLGTPNPLVVWACDPASDATAADFRIVVANPAFRNSIGAPFPALEGLSLVEIMPGRGNAALINSMRDVLAGTENARADYEYQTNWRRFRVRLYSPYPGHVVSVFIPLVKQERLVPILRETARKLRGFIVSSLDGIVVSDEQGAVIEWNSAMAGITGLTSEAAVGRSLWDVQFSFLAPRDRTPERLLSLKNSIQSLLATGLIPENAAAGNREIYRPDGQQRIIQTVSFCVPTSRGYNLAGITRDTTDYTLNLERLQKSEEGYRTLLESMSDAVTVKDRDGHYIIVNTLTCQWLGVPWEQMVGKATPDLYPSEVARIIDEADRRVMDLGEITEVEHEVPTESGRRLVSSRKAPLRDAAGNVTGIVSIGRDITERRRAEDNLMRAQRLETAGRIAAQVAHDFNNMLGPLMAYPELMKLELPEGHPAARYCDAMIDMARRMSVINENLLTMSRRSPVDDQPASLGNVVLGVLMSQLAGHGSDLEIELDVAADLWSVQGNEADLHRMVSNLMANARDAMADSGVLSVRAQNLELSPEEATPHLVQPGKYVLLSITDTGAGMEPEQLERIFEAFFTTKTGGDRRGSGLGLSIVKSIVEDRGGFIVVDSVVGTGSTFQVYLPAVIDRGLDSRSQPHDVGLSGGAEHILVVDDDPDQLELAHQMLGRLGYTISTAMNGDEALARLREDPPDLMILDMVMPGGKDGAATFREALKIRPGQRAIMLSGYFDSERLREVEEVGSLGWLRKPLSMVKLAKAVRAALDGEPLATD